MRQSKQFSEVAESWVPSLNAGCQDKLLNQTRVYPAETMCTALAGQRPGRHMGTEKNTVQHRCFGPPRDPILGPPKIWTRLISGKKRQPKHFGGDVFPRIEELNLLEELDVSRFGFARFCFAVADQNKTCATQ